MGPGRWYMQVYNPSSRGYFYGQKKQKNGSLSGILYIEGKDKAKKSSVSLDDMKSWKEIQEEHVPKTIREQILSKIK